MKALFSGMRTTVDGGYKITFELDASQQAAIFELLKIKDKLLTVSIEEEN